MTHALIPRTGNEVIDFVAPRLASFVNIDHPRWAPLGFTSSITGLPLYAEANAPPSQQKRTTRDVIFHFSSGQFVPKKDGTFVRLTTGTVLVREHETVVSHNADYEREKGAVQHVAGHRAFFEKAPQNTIIARAFLDDYNGPSLLISIQKKTDYRHLLRMSGNSSRIHFICTDSARNKTLDRSSVRAAFTCLQEIEAAEKKQGKSTGKSKTKELLQYAKEIQWPSCAITEKSKKIAEKYPEFQRLVRDLPRVDSAEFRFLEKLGD